jgi:hypothetical protein
MWLSRALSRAHTDHSPPSTAQSSLGTIKCMWEAIGMCMHAVLLLKSGQSHVWLARSWTKLCRWSSLLWHERSRLPPPRARPLCLLHRSIWSTPIYSPKESRSMPKVHPHPYVLVMRFVPNYVISKKMSAYIFTCRHVHFWKLTYFLKKHTFFTKLWRSCISSCMFYTWFHEAIRVAMRHPASARISRI